MNIKLASELKNTFDDELPEEVPDFDESNDDEDEASIKRVLLTIRLFQEAIKKAQGNQNDKIIAKFAEYVLPNLVQQLAGTTAKGGKFFEVTIEKINAKRATEGKKPVRRDNAGDQSVLAHLLNGFFPTYRILKRLLQDDLETNPVRRNCEELQICIFIVCYLLHDYEKFPDYREWLILYDKDNQFKDRDWELYPAKKEDAANRNLKSSWLHSRVLNSVHLLSSLGIVPSLYP